MPKEDVPKPKDAPKRLTANPAKASVIRDHKTGQKLPRTAKEFQKCLQHLSF